MRPEKVDKSGVHCPTRQISSLQGIRRGLDDVKHARITPARDGLDQLRRQRKIPRGR